MQGLLAANSGSTSLSLSARGHLHVTPVPVYLYLCLYPRPPSNQPPPPSPAGKISMTKLLEWLTAAVLFLGPWTAVVTSTVQNEFTRKHFYEILVLPVLLVALFGVVSVAIIAYRVYTFNDCTEASVELQGQIKEAKADLAKKGLKLE